MSHKAKKPVLEHIVELRRRLLLSLLAIMVGSIIGYNKRFTVITWLIAPLKQKLYYTNPAGGFDFILKVSLSVGMLLALPYVLYHLISFIKPAMPRELNQSIAIIIFLSVMSALLGVCFAYYISLPVALSFLGEFATNNIESLITAQEYLDFALIYIGVFALFFQAPILFYVAGLITPLTVQKLMKYQKIVILICFIVAAIATPTPDPFNQILMAVPMIALYQVSIAAVWLARRQVSTEV
ncbi:twin-arginine translocase subunit TatC [Candidatus Saccharibacteria bacterium]|nr:twin-arginine translocase subunit TatC [Candidatus Saccharibacteria bacterium]